MIFHLGVFAWSALFGVGLSLFALVFQLSGWSGLFYSLVPLVIFSLAAARQLTNRYRNALVPILLSMASPALLSLVDNPLRKGAFVIITAVVYYFSFLGLYRLRGAPNDRTALSMLGSGMVAALFFFFSAVYGLYINFTTPLWALMVLYFFGAFAGAYQTLFVALGANRRKVATYSLLLGFAMAELAWVMNFWPFGYLTTGAVSLLAFFAIWDPVNEYFLGRLSRRRAALHVIACFLLAAVLLGSSPWRLLV